ncbi:MAG: PAS domain S-box protein [Planctomycetota bacterium]|jgi:PAS domain S-box-containing protein
MIKLEIIQTLKTLQSKISKTLNLPLLRPGKISDKQQQQLLHKLQVHQEKLEAQNQELRQIQQILEESCNHYADLYDLSQASYVTLDENGCIRDVNLSGAAQLGLKRAQLTRIPFTDFVDKSTTDVFLKHLQQCRDSGKKETAEVLLAIKDKPVWVQLLSISQQQQQDKGRLNTLYRMVIIDISKYKQVDDEKLNANWEASRF